MNAYIYLAICCVVLFITVILSGIVSYRALNKIYNKQLHMDISIEQMIASEKRIEEFLQENKIAPGAPIQTIAKALDIVEGGVASGLEGRARLNEPDEDGKMIVLFRQGLSEEDMQFDFAHECAHRINKDPAPATRPEGVDKPEIEQLADYVGAALLMPIESVYDYLVEAQYTEISCHEQIKVIHNLCQRYGVSKMIALRRVKEVYAIKQRMI